MRTPELRIKRKVPICIDCVHYTNEGEDSHWCMHPSVANDPVTGDPDKGMPCRTARSAQGGFCGVEGRMFQAKSRDTNIPELPAREHP